MPVFSARLIDWQRAHGRHGLPWQGSRDPYRIWLSEIMLQQTQVAAVIPYYTRFLARFPNVAALAAAPVEEVMALWSGLGYYARARNLHRAAREVVEKHDGRFPATAAALAELPGVGRSTAAAIAAFANGERAAILDGNVKRVLCRAFGITGIPGERAVEERLWALAETLLPTRGEDIGIYIQAQMDLGATVCTRARPACGRCPLTGECVALASGRVAELPTPRPRKTPPRRAARMAVVILGQSVLLERRPPAGIWGGLLALPEILPADADAETWAMRTFGLAQIRARELPPLVHAFTHFTLEITPWRIELPVPPRIVAEPAWQWLTLGQISAAALPAPVREILEGIAKSIAAVESEPVCDFQAAKPREP
ncbi:MAG: A/G-specific adenine glycosylase [Azoarcus sp.]|jgi:A/G-specific adenine glycosylase|nr:A/G-specific adenine glycosylase [Azoarcus sp.]